MKEAENEIEKGGIRILTEALKRNTSLRELNLGSRKTIEQR